MIKGHLLMAEYEKLPHGDSRIQAIKKAIALADEDKAYRFMYLFRSDLMSESEFHGDGFQAFIIFPEMIKLFDEHEEQLAEYQHDYMWNFKWILSDCSEYYQVSKEKAYELFDEFKKRCERYGYSLRPYYQQLYYFESSCDTKAARRAYQQFVIAKRDSMCDCYACEMDTRVDYELDNASIERALETAYPILSGQVKCANIPWSTYAKIMHKYYMLGDFENAEEYRKKCYRHISKESSFLSRIGDIMKLYSKTNLSKGSKIFEKHLIWELDSRNYKDKLDFYIGAASIFTKLAKKKTEVILNLSQKFELYNVDGVYKTETLAEYYCRKALDLIDKFDKRNESDFNMKEYEYAMAE